MYSCVSAFANSAIDADIKNVKKKALLDILKSYVDHPSANKYKDDMEIDLLDALSSDDVQGVEDISNFDILDYIIKSTTIKTSLAQVCDITNTGDKDLWNLNLSKMREFLEKKFNPFCEVIIQEQGGSSDAAVKSATIKASEIFFGEITSIILAYSYLTKKCSMTMNQHLAQKLFPEPEKKKGKFYKGTKEDCKKTEDEMEFKNKGNKTNTSNKWNKSNKKHPIPQKGGMHKFFISSSKKEDTTKELKTLKRKVD